MITLKPNANKLIGKQVNANGVRAFYLSVCERYGDGYVQCFITDLQNLITKVGILVALADRSGPNISYCAQALEYLCKRVLDNPRLYDTFDSIGVNNKGNAGKHSISTNSIDMDKAVATYNSMVDAIARNYSLLALKSLIVRKPKSKTTPSLNENKQKVKQQPSPAKHPAPKQTGPNESFTTDDQLVKLTATLLAGKGFYKKGLINKKTMLNFRLKVSIKNPEGYKITSAVATFSSNGYSEEMKLSADPSSTTEVDLEGSRFSGNIQATVTVTYKIGLFKTKRIGVTVAKNF